MNIKRDASGMPIDMEIKPCPFCGSDDIDWFETPNDNPETGYYGVALMCVCGAQGPSGGDHHEALERWNNRTNPAPRLDQTS